MTTPTPSFSGFSVNPASTGSLNPTGTPDHSFRPPGFPSDLDLTRMANEMFGRCDEPSIEPFFQESPQTTPAGTQELLHKIATQTPGDFGPSPESGSIPAIFSRATAGTAAGFPPSVRSQQADFGASPHLTRTTAVAPVPLHVATPDSLKPHPSVPQATPPFITGTPDPFAFLDQTGVNDAPQLAKQPVDFFSPHQRATAGTSDAVLGSVQDQVDPFVTLGHLAASPMVAVRPDAAVTGFHPSLEPAAIPQPQTSGLDALSARKDFPILSEIVHGKPLIWLDNAATTQKPHAVIDRLSHFYLHENSNVHRAAHELARRSTDAYEAARDAVARFLHAPDPGQIVFVRGTTEAINLVAQSFGRQNIAEGDEIIVTHLEHHANIVPWQQLCAEKKARLLVAPVDDTGQILLDQFGSLLSKRTRLVSLSQVSNALGTITPAREMIQMAHRLGIPVLLDGAQSVSHMRVDVQDLDCDFFVFSGHKVFGPTGIGVLYGKREILDAMPPWQGGGNMIQEVTFEKTVYHPAPMRFEAGTGNIADAVGLHAAIDYVQKVGLENIARYEHELLLYGTRQLNSIPELRIIGTAEPKAGVLSFIVQGHATETIGKALSSEGIAVRSGHHCAQPILQRFGLTSTVRASLAFYNTKADIDRLVSVVRSTVNQ